MPYRIDVPHAGAPAFDVVVELGALDAELAPDGSLAAIFPDSVAPDAVARALRSPEMALSPAVPRDAGSVWVLRPRALRIGSLTIAPADAGAGRGTLRLVDGGAFGTGLHPTTALCLEALEDEVRAAAPGAVLDVGTGSGVLALAALTMGVPEVVAVDVDEAALREAAENARLNGLEARLDLRRGGPDALTGSWPLVLANILAAPLVAIAPALSQRVASRGRLIVSGVPRTLEADVERAYLRVGMHRVRVTSRGGWIALVLQASW